MVVSVMGMGPAQAVVEMRPPGACPFLQSCSAVPTRFTATNALNMRWAGRQAGPSRGRTG